MKQSPEDELLMKLGTCPALTPEVRDLIASLFTQRGIKALRAIDEGRVVRYRDFAVVTGATGRYIVDEDFCTCKDFLYRNRRCWHILAVWIADISGTMQEIDGWYLDTLRE